MNKVFKVIWSEARNAYVVVSEIAKNHGSKSCSTKKLLTMLIATGVMTCASMAPAMAAPNVDASATVNVGKKAAVNVAENAKVNVKKDAKVNVEESAELTVKNGAKVTFSKDAGIGFENGAKINLGSKAGVTLADGAKLSVAKGSNVSVDKNITMGNGAVSSPYVGQTGNVAIGENAKAWNGNGLQEALMDFGQGGAKVKSFFGVPYRAEIVDGTKLPGSIAIGKNTVARSGSTMIGDHGYTGKIGDTTITPDGNGIMKYNNDVYSTTIGANSFNSGALASVTGVFSIASSKYDGDNYKFHAVQNTGATIYGSMNSIESATSDAEYSGIASSVLGFANKTQNANAALIWGTGNEVTNSIESIDIDYNGWNKLSVAEAQQKAIEAMQSSKYAGGSVMAIGGGNKADYAKYSQLTGVQNKVTGTKAKAAKYDFVNGYQNTVTNASDVTVIGIKNEVTADGNKVIGDNQKVSGKNNVIFGSADKVTETTVNNAVVLGHNAKVTGEGGVALGAGSVASTAAGVLGYGADGKTDATWQATKGAVSVGGNGATRQITNVAAGTADTDAVNVAQLKKVNEEALKHSTVTNGDNITVTKDTNKDGGKEYKVALNNDITLAGDTGDFVSISGSKGTIRASGSVTAGSVVAGSVVMDGATSTVSGLSNTTTAYDGFANGEGKAATEEQLKEVSKVAENANQGWNLSTNGGKASKVAPGETVDFSGDKNISVSHDGTKVKVELNKDIDVNSVQTNALNSKYNLSVGTMAENGIMPFFVNSTGDFYAAHNKFHVDKDGKVTATAGEIGNVVLNNGVFTGHSALRDGELFVGDASGNYSQITTKGAKLGKVTVAEDGKISGVAAGAVTADSTDAVNGSQLHQTNENVAALDKRVTQNEADIAQNKADIAANRADIDKNRADIDKNTADIAQNKTDIKNLDNRVTNVEELAKKHTTVTAGDNITVTEDKNADGGKEYKVALDKDIKLDSVTTGQTVMNNDGLKVGKDVSVTATAVTAGKTSISDEGVKVGDKTYISADGLNANDQKVTNVAAGELSATSKDAVNGSQLYQTNQEVANNTNRINKLGSRVNKVGAGAAALAALHPLDFDPDAKWDFAAGYGNYNGENAAAIGAYYRPNEDTMFSVGGSFGNGENMVNAGVSFKLGSGSSHVSTSRVAMAKEIKELREHMAAQDKLIAQLTGPVNALTGSHIQADLNTLFPDVPKNHWAYDYVTKLAQEGYIEGYPDGNFKGDAMMTRYEFAAVIYRAMMNGAARDAKLGGDENLNKLLKEFEPELEYIRIDTIAKDKAGNPTIQRVRTVKANTNK